MGREATQFKPGQSGNPNGRPPGSSNTRSLELANKIEKTGLLPVEYLASVYQDESVSQSLRIAAARAAAPYVHSRLSSVTMDCLVDLRSVEELSDAELALAIRQCQEDIERTSGN